MMKLSDFNKVWLNAHLSIIKNTFSVINNYLVNESISDGKEINDLKTRVEKLLIDLEKEIRIEDED